MEPIYFKYFQIKGKRAAWNALSDAILEKGETASLKEVAEHAGVPIDVAQSAMKAKHFQKHFESRLVARGFNGAHFQEKVRRVNYLLVNEIIERIEDKKIRKDMTDKDIQGMLMSLNVCVRTAAQTEEILAKEDTGKKMMPPEEVMRRMLNSSSGRKLLKVVGDGQS